MFNLKNLDDATEFTLTFLLILCTLCCVHRSCTANHLFMENQYGSRYSTTSTRDFFNRRVLYSTVQ